MRPSEFLYQLTVEIEIDSEDVDENDESGLTAAAFDRLHAVLSDAGFSVQNTFLNGELTDIDRKEDL